MNDFEQNGKKSVLYYNPDEGWYWEHCFDWERSQVFTTEDNATKAWENGTLVWSE